MDERGFPELYAGGNGAGVPLPNLVQSLTDPGFNMSVKTVIQVLERDGHKPIHDEVINHTNCLEVYLSVAVRAMTNCIIQKGVRDATLVIP